MSTRRVFRFVAAASAFIAAVSGLAPPGAPSARAHHIDEWYEGIAEYSTILNCFSIIGGYPYDERGAAAWMSFESDPANAKPAVGESFDIKISVFGLGNACSGQRFIPAFSLPAGVALDPARDVTCWTSFDGKPLTQATSATDCPDSSTNFASATFAAGATMYLSSDTQNARTWPLPSGVLWEFRIPVKATSAQTSSNLQGHVKMFDGNNSPVLTPSQGLFVFGAASSPYVWYDQPSTFQSATLPTDIFTTFPDGTPSAHGVISVGYVSSQNTEGSFYMELGSSPGTSGLASVLAGATSPSDPLDGYQIAADWEESVQTLVAGQTYYWRLRYDRTVGADIVGAEQSFTMPTRTTCNGLDVTVNMAMGQQPTDGDDVILGTAASETIAAQAGNDTILGGLGNDWIDGGSGIDTASYENAPSGVTVSLATGAAQNTVGEGSDTLSSIANLTGSSHNDRLTGNATDNVLGGLAGRDTLVGAGGDDSLTGGDDDDTVDPGSGNDDVRGDAGTDTVTYATAAAGVRVSLASTSNQNTVGSGTDRIRTVENLIGTARSDVLTGSSSRNVLTGGASTDTLNGGKGNDRLNGGTGRDTCNGGKGSDTKTSCEVNTGFP